MMTIRKTWTIVLLALTACRLPLSAADSILGYLGTGTWSSATSGNNAVLTWSAPTSYWTDTNSPALRYWFDPTYTNTSGTVNDSSGNGNHGTIVPNYASGFLWRTGITNQSGRVDHYADFDGADDYISLPTSDSLRLTNDFTIAFWAKVEDAAASDKIFARKFNATSDYSPYIDEGTSGNTWRFGYNTGVGAYNAVGHPNVGPALTVGAWQHVAWVHTVATNQIYTNGVYWGGGAATAHPAAATNIYTVGSSSVQHYDGDVDDFVIYNKALTADQILARYNATTNRMEAGY